MLPNGLEIERDIRGSLSWKGFVVSNRNRILDRLKIDIVVFGIPNDKGRMLFDVEHRTNETIAIQVTTWINNDEKRNEFFTSVADNTQYGRFLYLEIEQEADLSSEEGALTLVAALSQFIKNRDCNNNRFGWVRIFNDLTYRPFPIPEPLVRQTETATEHMIPNITEAPPVPQDTPQTAMIMSAPTKEPTPTKPPVPPEKPILHGHIISWNKASIGSWGWVEAMNGPIYHLSLKNIADGRLREHLDQIGGTMTVFKHREFPVRFKDGGLPPPPLSKKKAKGRRENEALEVTKDEGYLALPSRIATSTAA